MKRRKRENKEDDDDNGFAAWGGYMEAKKSKLREQYSNSVKNECNKQSDLFHGVSIFVNGYTKPSSEELKQIMSLHGGIYHHYHIPRKTTYIIASNLPDTKIKQLGANQKIIKPEWVTDCLQAKKLLDYSNYLLYTNQNRKQPKLNFEKITKDEESNENSVQTDEPDVCNPHSPDIFGSNEECMEVNNKTDIVPEIATVNNNSANETYAQNKNKTLNSTTDKTSKDLVPIEPARDKSGRTLTANDPKFLSEFYNNSRLHHIATLGATFKQHVCNLREESNGKFSAREKLTTYISSTRQNISNNSFPVATNNSVIMHIDMDCFFVSVGLRKRPELRGVPVAVTHSKGGQEPSLRSGVDRKAELDCYKQRIQDKLKSKGLNDFGPGNMLVRLDGIENQSMSEIASCSYEARKAGVKNGMFMGTALKLCPNLQTIPYDFEGYKEVAYTLYNTIAEYTLNIEGVSCDEMFVDITELLKETGASVNEWATYIRAVIQERTGCPCSTGFGANRLQARMATRTAKPNGQFHLLSSAVEEYMVDVRVDDLPGVGRSTTLKLGSLGIKTCGDLQSMSIGKLQSEFGAKIGETLYQHCRGLDDRPLVYEHERKSVSAEINYGIRFSKNSEAETFLTQLATEVHSRLMDVRMKGKCITLKLMVRSKDAPVESSKFMGHGICDYITKSNTLPIAVCDLDIITREVLQIFQKLSLEPTDLRGIGIQISRLEKQNSKAKTSFLTKFFNTNNSTVTTSSNNKNESINSTSVLQDTNETKLTGPEKIKHVNLDNKKDELNLINLNSGLLQNNNKIIQEQVKETVQENGVTNIKDKSVSGKNLGINQIQNSIKRGRGRPRGKGNRTIVRKPSNNNVLDKFLAPQQNIVKENTYDDIDMEVLAALPDDIRKEVLEQYQLKNTNISKKTESNCTNDIRINEKIIMKEPDAPKIINKDDGISKDKQSSSKEKNEIKKQCMFSGMNIKQIKELLQDWVSSVNTPENCDVKMLGNFFKQLALDKKIDDLFMMLKFLYSEIQYKNSCGWHRTYFEVVNRAQKGMIERYGHTIWTYKDFQCEKHCSLPNR